MRAQECKLLASRHHRMLWFAPLMVLLGINNAWSQASRVGGDVAAYLARSKGGPVGRLDDVLQPPTVCLWRSPEDASQVEICVGDISTPHHRIVRSRKSGSHWLNMIPAAAGLKFPRLTVSADSRVLLDELKTFGQSLGGLTANPRLTLLEDVNSAQSPAVAWGPSTGPWTMMLLGSTVKHDFLVIVDDAFRESDGSVVLPSGFLATVKRRESDGWRCVAIGQEGLTFTKGSEAVIDWSDFSTPPTITPSPSFALNDVVAASPGWVRSLSPGSADVIPASVSPKAYFAGLAVTSATFWSAPTHGGYQVDPEIWIFAAP